MLRSPPFKPSAFPLLFALRLTRLAICVCSVISLTSPNRTTVEFSVAWCSPLLSLNAFAMAGWNSIVNHKIIDRRKGLLNVQLSTPKQGCAAGTQAPPGYNSFKESETLSSSSTTLLLKIKSRKTAEMLSSSLGKITHAKYTRNKTTIVTVPTISFAITL